MVTITIKDNETGETEIYENAIIDTKNISTYVSPYEPTRTEVDIVFNVYSDEFIKYLKGKDNDKKWSY